MKTSYLFILALTVAAYTGAWFYGADRAEKELIHRIKHLEKKGDYFVEYQAISKEGFPFAITLNLKNPKVKINHKDSTYLTAVTTISQQGEWKIKTSLFDPTYYLTTHGTTDMDLQSFNKKSHIKCGPTTLALKLDKDQHLARFFKGTLFDHKEYKQIKELKIENTGINFINSNSEDVSKMHWDSISLMLQNKFQKDNEKSWLFEYQGKGLIVASEKQDSIFEEIFSGIFGPVTRLFASLEANNQLHVKGSVVIDENPYLEDLFLSKLPCGTLTLETLNGSNIYYKIEYPLEIKSGFNKNNEKYFVELRAQHFGQYTKEYTKLWEKLVDPDRLNSLTLTTEWAQKARQKMLEKPAVIRSFIPNFELFNQLKDHFDIKVTLDVKGDNKEIALVINDFDSRSINYGFKIDRTLLTFALQDVMNAKFQPVGTLNIHLKNYKSATKALCDYTALIVDGIEELADNQFVMIKPVATFTTEFLQSLSNQPQEDTKDLDVTVVLSLNPSEVRIGTLTMQQVLQNSQYLYMKHVSERSKTNINQAEAVKTVN